MVLRRLRRLPGFTARHDLSRVNVFRQAEKYPNYREARPSCPAAADERCRACPPAGMKDSRNCPECKRVRRFLAKSLSFVVRYGMIGEIQLFMFAEMEL